MAADANGNEIRWIVRPAEAARKDVMRVHGGPLAAHARFAGDNLGGETFPTCISVRHDART